MPYYVYIVQSQFDQSYYKGFSENPPKRLLQRNNGECISTARKVPWTFVYIEELFTKREALIPQQPIAIHSKHK